MTDGGVFLQFSQKKKSFNYSLIFGTQNARNQFKSDFKGNENKAMFGQLRFSKVVFLSSAP